MKLEFASFVGMKPELSEKLIPANYATHAVNVNTSDGSITSWHGLSFIENLGKTGTINTLHRMISGTFLHWTEEVSLARVPISNNTNERVIFTGQDKPRYTDELLAISGGGINYPEVSYYLDIPAPSQALTVSVGQNTPDGIQLQYNIAGTVDDTIGDRLPRTYVYTLCTSNNVEGPPSPPSAIAYANQTEQITLDNFENVPVGAYDITKYRIYVSVNGSNFLFLDQQTFPSAPYIDSNSTTLGDAIETTLYSAPPAGLKYVKNMANGMVVGALGNDLYFSEPYQVQGWPEDYIQTLETDITGISAAGNMLLCPTDGHPYTGIGNHPNELVVDKLAQTQGNLSFRSLVDINNGVMYASNDGVIWLNDGQAIVVSESIISEDIWQLMVPSSIHAYFYRGMYFGFYDSGLTGTITAVTGEKIPAKGGFILDHLRESVSYTDVHCDAAYSDTRTSSLFLCINEANVNKVYEWNADKASSLLPIWETRTTSTSETVFTAGRVDSRAYPVTMKVYGDDVLRHTEVVADDTFFRMPSGYKARNWSIEITSGNKVDGIFMATTPSEL